MASIALCTGILLETCSSGPCTPVFHVNVRMGWEQPACVSKRATVRSTTWYVEYTDHIFFMKHENSTDVLLCSTWITYQMILDSFYFQCAGDCICRPGYAGPRCDRCEFGYSGYPLCEPCPCNPSGSINPDPCEGDCVCKVGTW